MRLLKNSIPQGSKLMSVYKRGNSLIKRGGFALCSIGRRLQSNVLRNTRTPLSLPIRSDAIMIRAYTIILIVLLVVGLAGCGGGSGPAAPAIDTGATNDSASDDLGGVNVTFRQYDGGEKDGQWFVQIEHFAKPGYLLIRVTSQVRAYSVTGNILLDETTVSELHYATGDTSKSDFLDVSPDIVGVKIISWSALDISLEWESKQLEPLLGTWVFGFYSGDAGISWPQEPLDIAITRSETGGVPDPYPDCIDIAVPQSLLEITGDPAGFSLWGYEEIKSNAHFYGGYVGSPIDPFNIHYYSYDFTLQDDGAMLLSVGVPSGSPGYNGEGETALCGQYVGQKK